MSERLVSILLVAAGFGTGLNAGLFFIFSNTVMTALGRMAPSGGIAAMQQINIVIQNPVFFLAFFGTALLSVVLVATALIGWLPSGAGWALAGAVVYLTGIIAVTIVFNVPMNNALAAVDPASAAGEALWQDYLARWTMWNHVRTVSGLISSGTFILAIRMAA
jgi:uncharacterized membrane protein